MIKVHWSYLAIVLALIIGLFLGSQMQFAPSLALAQSTTTDNTGTALTVYNSNVYVIRGNALYLFKVIDHPIFKNAKTFVLIAKTPIDLTSADTTGGANRSNNPPPRPPAATATAAPKK